MFSVINSPIILFVQKKKILGEDATNERFHQQNIYQYGPKCSIMIWAAISADGKSDIKRLNENVTARRYMAEAVKPGIMPFVNRHNRPMTFQHENAPGNRAHATRGWLAS